MLESHLTTVHSDIIVLLTFGKMLAFAFILITLAMAGVIMAWFILMKLKVFGLKQVKPKKKKRVRK